MGISGARGPPGPAGDAGQPGNTKSKILAAKEIYFSIWRLCLPACGVFWSKSQTGVWATTVRMLKMVYIYLFNLY